MPETILVVEDEDDIASIVRAKLQQQGYIVDVVGSVGEAEAAVTEAMSSGRGWDLELPFIQRGGRRIWVRAVGQAEFEGGLPVRLFGALQDITQQVEQRQALEAAQHNYAARDE